MKKSNFNKKILALLSSGVVLTSGALASCGNVNEETSSNEVTTSTMGENTNSKTTTTTTSNSNISISTTTTSKATTTKKSTTTKATTTTKKQTTTQTQNNGGNTNNDGYVDNNDNNNDNNNNNNDNNNNNNQTTTQRQTEVVTTTTQRPTTTTTTTQAPQPSGPSESDKQEIADEFYIVEQWINEDIDNGNYEYAVVDSQSFYIFIQCDFCNYTSSGVEVYFRDLNDGQKNQILDLGSKCEKLLAENVPNYKQIIQDTIREVFPDYTFKSINDNTKQKTK